MRHSAPHLRRPALAMAVVAAALAGSVPAAEATFPGKRGPIAFQRLTNPRDEESAKLFTVERPGAAAHRLTGGNGFNADYSPDGRRIAFERRYGGVSPDAVITIGADGSSRALVTTSCAADPCLGDNSPAWSPDGGRLVFERAFAPTAKGADVGLDLVTANPDGTAERVILHSGSGGLEGKGPHDAQWSPDGTRIAVNMVNGTAKPRDASAIYVLDADGSNLRRITPMRLNAGNPDWSPDGTRIVFNSSYEGQGAVELYTVHPDGGGLRRVRKEPNGFSFEPSWAPDGTRLAFVHGSRTHIPHIWTMRMDGTGLRQVTHGSKPDLRPDWGSR